MLRHAQIDAGDEYVGAQTLELANARAKLFLVLVVFHRFASRPDAGAGPVLSAKKAHSHNSLLFPCAQMPRTTTHHALASHFTQFGQFAATPRKYERVTHWSLLV
jgi:hypothetical protein